MYRLIKRKIKQRLIKRIPEDLFMRRLRSLVIGEGMLNEGNIYLIDYAIKNMPKGGSILEIGSFGGLSTNLILHLLKKNDRMEKLLTCDPWIYEKFDSDSSTESKTIDGRVDITQEEYSIYMKTAFMNSVRFLHKDHLPYTFNLTSDDFFKHCDIKSVTTDLFERELPLGFSLSFSYIDGNHAYEYVKRDFENVDKYLLKGGLILFDDSDDDLKFGSADFMKEMLINSNYKFIEKNPNYLFKKMK